MNEGKYVFCQLIAFLPKRVFDWIVQRYQGDKYVKDFTCWNQLLVMMYGQLSECGSLRELTDAVSAHRDSCYHLGFGKKPVSRSNLAYANEHRDYRIFEEMAYKMIAEAQRRRLDRIFTLHGRFYAVDSTTIDLCMSLFQWALFRSQKAGIKMHTQFDVVTQIPTYFHITHAKMSDVKAMDELPYEPGACYIFDRGYFDLERLFRLELIGSDFVIREKRHLRYEVLKGSELLDNDDNVIQDQTIRLKGVQTTAKYPAELRRIVYYSEEHGRTFTYLTNNFHINAADIAMLYKQRWQVELFFKWIKQHLRVKSYWGTSENAVRIQICTAIISYCLIAIVEHDLKLGRSTFDVLRIIGHYLRVKVPVANLFKDVEPLYEPDPNQLQLELNFC